MFLGTLYCKQYQTAPLGEFILFTFLEVHFMPGSRMFCQRGSNFDVFFFLFIFFLVCLFLFFFYKGRNDPNTTVSGPLSASQGKAI